MDRKTETDPGWLTVGFIGNGRAASTMARGLARRGHDIVIARRGPRAEALARDLGARMAEPGEVLATADVTFLAVPDAVVPQLAEELASGAAPGAGRLVAHLAGSLGRDALAPLARRGYGTAAIHPLQVLSGWRIAAVSGFAVDAGDDVTTIAGRLVDELGGVQMIVPASARTAYHAAAVIAANLGMTMLAEAVDILVQQGIPRDAALQALGALVRGGLEASMDRGLPAALTGPVARGDAGTIRAHLDVLAADPELRQAYVAASLLTLRQVQRDQRPADAEAAAATRRVLDAAL